MAEPIASAVAPLIVNPSVGFAQKHFGYVWNNKKNIAELKRHVEKLDAQRDDTSHSVTAAQSNAEKIKTRVEMWLDGASKTSHEARNILQDYQELEKKMCLMRCCPNPISSYQLGRRACKIALEIKEAITEAGQIDTVSVRAVGEGTSDTLSTKGLLNFESRKSTLEDIMKTLQDETMNSIGVYGLGGMGKTTLVKLVASRAAEENMFEEIVMASVTQIVDMKEIQGQIARKLDLEFKEFTIAERAGRIDKRLKGKKVLVILDDIWTKLDLTELGIPLGAEHMDCKVLFTSRSLRVLSLMGTEKEYVLEALKEDEAWRLFEEKVIHIVKKPAFLVIGKEVAKRCAGLPVLIVAVAASLAKRPHLDAWNDALTQVKKMNNKNMHDIVKSVMESISYECLNETHKRLFLLCGLMQGKVYIEDILKYSLGWDLFGEDAIVNVEGARNRLHALIFDLKESCLLLNDYASDLIKMHDVVRDVAISIARKDLNAFSKGDNDTDVSRWPKNDELKKCTAMVFRKCRKLPCFPQRLECPSLQLFNVDGFNVDSKPTIPDTFFERSSKLKVLDMSAFCFPTLPSTLSFLTNLQSLHLDYCDGLQDISIVGELKKLQVLSLIGSTIQELPSSLGQLSELRLLDLNGCSQLKVIPSGLISGLSQLEELHMSESFDRWKSLECLSSSGRSNASFAELKCLPNLTSLKVEVRDAKLLAEDLNFENLKRYEIMVGDMWGQSFRKWFKTLKTKTIIAIQLGTDSINHLQHVGNTLFKSAECLCLGELKGINNVIPELKEDGFPELKYLRMEKDYEIQYIVNVEDKQHNASFPALESLYLSGLLKVEKICNGQLMEGSFNNLKTVEVQDCNRLESLFSYSTIIGLPCLEEIQVSNCEVLEEIVAKKRGEDGDDDVNRESTELVPLRKLALKCLPSLITFLNCNKVPMVKRRPQEIIAEEEESTASLPLFDEVSFPNLEELELSKISNLTEIWSHKLGDVACCNLTRLTVTKCDNLKYLFTPSHTRVLAGLQQLTIRDCVSMKQVVAREEGETKTETIVFPQLSYLWLDYLPNLTTFYSGLVEEITTVEKLETATQPLFNEKVQFPSLKTLKIQELNGVKVIWPDTVGKTNSLKKELQQLLIFQNLSEVIVDSCESLKYVFPTHMAQSLNQLKQLRILDCGMETIIDGGEDTKLGEIKAAKDLVTPTFAFPKLVTIYLYRLRKVKCFYPREHTIEWPALKEFDVANCDQMSVLDLLTSAGIQGDNHIPKVLSSLEHLCIRGRDIMKLYDLIPPHFSLKRLTITEFDLEFATFPSRFLNIVHNQLEAFRVYDCSFQEIFPNEGEVTDHADDNVLLAQLRKLELEKLSELKYIIREQDRYSPLISSILDGLVTLVVRECPRLTNLAPSFESFRSLQYLTIVNCCGLINLIGQSTARCLEQLRMLWIGRCQMMEEIVGGGIGKVRDDDDEETTALDHEISFNNLYYLTLDRLPRLTSFYSSRLYAFSFPKLVGVDVIKCPNMKTFCGGITTTPKLRSVHLNLSKSEERWEEGLNTTIEQIYAETEAKRLAITIPSTSSNNHFEVEAQGHDNSTEGQTRQNAANQEHVTNIVDKGKGKEVDVSKEVEGHFEKSQETPCSSDPSCSNYAAYIAPSQHVGASSSQLSPQISNLLYEVSPLAIEGIEEKVQFHDIQAGVLPEPRKEGLICKNGAAGELVNQDQVCDNGTYPVKEMELCGNGTEPIKGSEICEEVTGVGKEVDIGDNAIKPVILAASCPKVQEQTIAVSQASRDVGASPSNSQQKDIQELHVTKHFVPLLSPALVTQAEVQILQDMASTSSETARNTSEVVGTTVAASFSLQKDFKGLLGTEDIIARTSEYFQNLQAQELKSISAEQVKIMEAASEWLSGYVRQARECVEQSKVISELELKIIETEALLQALQEKKRAAEEIYEAKASYSRPRFG